MNQQQTIDSINISPLLIKRLHQNEAIYITVGERKRQKGGRDRQKTEKREKGGREKEKEKEQQRNRERKEGEREKRVDRRKVKVSKITYVYAIHATQEVMYTYSLI